MKNILNSKEKISEKAFSQSLLISVISILLCIVALCSVTWAWFSTEISSSSSDIKSAYCDVNVTVVSEDSKLESIGGKYSFLKDKAYKIQISATGTAETAYCILKIDGVDYYTAQIPTHTAMNFTLQFDAEVTDVEIIRCWGTSSVPDANRTFINGGLYLNCEATAELPKAIMETNSTKEAIESQPIINGTTAEGTKTSEVVTESDTAEAAEVVTDISPSETTQ